NPKVWLLWVPEKGIVRLSSAELRVWGKVETACLEQLECLMPWAPSSKEPWLGPRGLLQELLDQMAPEDHILPAPELTVAGRVKALLVAFARSSSERIHNVREESDRYVFKLEALVTYYQNGLTWAARHHALTRWQIARGIEELGGKVSVREYVEGKRQRLT